MEYCKVDEIKFKADDYIDVAYYDTLYEVFAQKMGKGAGGAIKDKYLLAVFVACIEGHINLDIDNNSWYNWLYAERKNCESEGSYLILNIYEFIESDRGFFDFITKYFNLWHDEEKDPYCIYDANHKRQLEENFKDLIYVIEMDIKKAKNKKANYIVELYNKLENVLINTFNKKNYSFEN